jgi:ABC-type Fe3+/spermidine/putrescine transport system ATPase subunit
VLLKGNIAFACAAPGTLAAGASADVVLRQEDIRFAAPAEAGTRANVHPARVLLRAFSGARVQYVLAVRDTLELVMDSATNGPDAAHEPGEQVFISIDPAHVYVSAPETAA